MIERMRKRKEKLSEFREEKKKSLFLCSWREKMDDLGRSKGMTIVPLSHFSIVPCCTYGLVPKAIKRRKKRYF